MPRMMDALAGRRRPPRARLDGADREGRLLRPLPLRGPLPRRRHGGRLRRPGPGRSASAAGRARWPLPQSVILTPHTEMSMKFMVEISRGCPCMCRFCWAGYNYLPVRGFSRKQIVDRAREVRAVTHKIGLVSTAVCDHPEIDGIVDDLAGMGYEVSVASLRLDDLTPDFVLQARRHRRAGADPGPRVRHRPHAPHPEQAVHQRRDPGQGHLDLRERHPEPEALLHGRAALGGARGRGGDRQPHGADPRAHARRWAARAAAWAASTPP